MHKLFRLVHPGMPMSFLRQIPSMIEITRQWLREPDPGSRAVRLLVLLAFLASTIGIPVGGWSVEKDGAGSAASPWCRCSTSAKQSGSCCCAKNAAGATQGGCCAARQPTRSTATAQTTTDKGIVEAFPGGLAPAEAGVVRHEIQSTLRWPEMR